MAYTLKNIQNTELYGFYDIYAEYYIWSGSFKDVLKKLKFENEEGYLKNLEHLRFCGIAISKDQGLNENDTEMMLNYYTDDEHIKTYAKRSYCLVHQSGSIQRVLNLFDIYNMYKSTIQTIESLPSRVHKRSQKVSRTHRKGYSYKQPKNSGIRLEMSRLKEDLLYIPTLNKSKIIANGYYKVVRIENSWKDKKVRHQWQQHIKY